MASQLRAAKIDGAGSDLLSRLMHPFIRQRIGPICSVVVIIACGLACRWILGGIAGEHLGNVAWGAMWTLVVLFVAPRARVLPLGIAATVIVFGIEYFQLTPYPARWSSESVLARYLVGGAFEWHDLIGGALGIILTCIAIRCMRYAVGRWLT